MTKRVIEIYKNDVLLQQTAIDFSRTVISVAYLVGTEDFENVYLDGKRLTNYSILHYTLEQLGAKPMSELRFERWRWNR